VLKIILPILLLILCACDDVEKKVVEKKRTIVVTNYPLYWLTESIAGNTVEIIYSVPANIDPAYWQPEDQDIAKMQQADLILLNGANYEKWLNVVELPKSKLVDTSANCQQMFIEVKEQVKHEHDGKVHSHSGYDFNIWLDAYILSRQAETLTSSLCQLMPAHQKLYKEKLLTLKNELKKVFFKINRVAGKQQKFLASHPVYNYLARANNWQLESFHWEPNEMPSPLEWARLQKATKFSRFMLFEDQPTLEIENKLAEFGVKAIVFRPCGKAPTSKDFLIEMKANLKNLQEALESPN
jgi:zinc transport system substrate-binding protein